MRWPWQPKHTFRSGLLRILEGLENGSIVLKAEGDSTPRVVEVAVAQLNAKFLKILADLEQGVAAREQAVAERERAVAAREQALADQESRRLENPLTS